MQSLDALPSLRRHRLVQVSLIDPTSGRVLWTSDHPSRPATPGVVNLGDGYAIGARKVMEELLAPLGADRRAK